MRANTFVLQRHFIKDDPSNLSYLWMFISHRTYIQFGIQKFRSKYFFTVKYRISKNVKNAKTIIMSNHLFALDIRREFILITEINEI